MITLDSMGAHILNFVRKAICLLLLAGAVLAYGQEAPVEDLHGAFEQGRKAFDKRRYEEAAAQFGQVFKTQPHFVEAGQGSAAYWLGRANEALRDEDRALRIWQAGLGALALADQFDARLADAYVRHVFGEAVEREYERAASTYLGLLAHLDRPLTDDEAALVDRHVAQMMFLLPDALRERVIDDPSLWGPAKEKWRLKPGAASVLLAWWRRQDPMPGTRGNERVEEHLRRVAYAEREYRYKKSRTGFDDRGEVYVRLGEPSRTTSVSFVRASSHVLRPGVPVSFTDLPMNEIWRYHHVGDRAYYLFVKRQGRYRDAQIYDFMPSVLRYFSSSRRGRRKAAAALKMLEDIYDELALVHPDFVSRREELIDYLYEYSGAKPPPYVFAQSFLDRGRNDDGYLFAEREITVPRQHTEVYDALDQLPISLRAARFLDDDGSTRTEIYWSHVPGTLDIGGEAAKQYAGANAPDQFLMHLTAVRQFEDYTEHTIINHRYVIGALRAGADSLVDVKTLSLPGDTSGLYHLALQWDQHLAVVQAGRTDQAMVGPRLKTGVYQVDSLAALSASPGTLEMSDVVPILMMGEVADENYAPYPYTVINTGLPLGFYFEVYHLVYGTDDQTHYTVEYEVVRAGTGGALRFLGRGGEERTSVSTTYTGSSRTVQEMIALDLSDWDGKGDLEVRVTVEDETTGRTVTRPVFFVLEPPKEGQGR